MAKWSLGLCRHMRIWWSRRTCRWCCNRPMKRDAEKSQEKLSLIINSYFKNVLNEIKSSHSFLLLLVIAYISSITVGFLCGAGDFYYTKQNHNIVYSNEQLYSLNAFTRFTQIARNNLLVSFKCLVGSAFSCGIYAIFLLSLNGFIFGDMIGRSSHILSIHEIYGATLPHSTEFVGIAILGLTGRIISIDMLHKFPLKRIANCMLLICIAIFIIITSAIFESYVSMSCFLH